MPPERNKGQAGLGGRGKNQSRNRQDQATARRRRSAVPRTAPGERGATLPGLAADARGNQKRNQRAGHQKKRMAQRY